MTSGPTGNETRDALAAVLEDQAEQRQRREERPEPKERSQTAHKLVIPLAAVTLWFVIAPPAVLRPRPVPAPTFEAVRNGLHMDIYMVATQVVRYRNANGRLPGTLVEALPGPEAATSLTYTRGPDETFEIGGERDGQAVVYRSSESLTQFVANARVTIREGPGS